MTSDSDPLHVCPPGSLSIMAFSRYLSTSRMTLRETSESSFMSVARSTRPKAPSPRRSST
eukprot:CAMPEP_0181500634 /NCGR_PEP_ID=MMETSP1110-20121109/55334_1 /TAXON_ID=174948 /ORGANISM="Symbiodinium sp., Strain CCMP421" /LENGTH=59 /DNA_ID=CAMNT_0023628975 /DNA_START=644 /DNA_END=819 /DNA_ORIENTATION=-